MLVGVLIKIKNITLFIFIYGNIALPNHFMKQNKSSYSLFEELVLSKLVSIKHAKSKNLSLRKSLFR